jgi:hypothetical protein
MKSLLFLLVAAVASLMGGCTTASLNPLATPETVVMDQDLVGRWVDVENDETTYVVTAAGDNAYQLKCIPKDASRRTLEFSLQICRLAETRFIDLTVTKAAGDELKERYGTTVVSAHSFMKMKRKGDELTVWQIKNDWLNSGLKSGEIKLAHATMRPDPGDEKETYVLTGPTSELQTFFRKIADNEEAFEKPTVFRRDTGEKPGTDAKKGAAK